MPANTGLTNSAMTDFRRCEERYRLKYRERLSPLQESPHLGLGSAVHEGLEKRGAIYAIQYLREKNPPYTKAEADRLEIQCATAAAMVNGALKIWTEWPDRQEIQFDLPLINPMTGKASTKHTMSGKLDGLWESVPESVVQRLRNTSLRAPLRGNPPCVMEIKTTSHAASEELQTEVSWVLYRVIRKPSLRLRTKVKRPDGLDEKGKPKFKYSHETATEFCERIHLDYEQRPDHYYSEFLVRRKRDQIQRFRHEIWEQHKRLLRIENGEMTIRNTGSCLDYGRCDFFELCTGAVGPEAYRVRESLNPELE